MELKFISSVTSVKTLTLGSQIFVDIVGILEFEESHLNDISIS